MDLSFFDKRPIVIAVAGPNGAGKSFFVHSQYAGTGLRFINADILAAGMDLEPYAAAKLADSLRRAHLKSGESFIFETVFSDPVGDKLAFLEGAVRQGYNVALCFIGISGPDQSEQRVAMRVAQGGHDVPGGKIAARFPRTLANLKAAMARLPHVFVFDNSNLQQPFREVVRFEEGRQTFLQPPVPEWLQPMISIKTG